MNEPLTTENQVCERHQTANCMICGINARLQPKPDYLKTLADHDAEEIERVKWMRGLGDEK